MNNNYYKITKNFNLTTWFNPFIRSVENQKQLRNSQSNESGFLSVIIIDTLTYNYIRELSFEIQRASNVINLKEPRPSDYYQLYLVSFRTTEKPFCLRFFRN